MLVAASLTVAFVAVAAVALIIWGLILAETSSSPAALVGVALLPLLAGLIAGGYAIHYAERPVQHTVTIGVCPVAERAP